MKNFFIVRHAKSSWSQHGLSDIERPLNKRGNHDAPKMAAYLKNNLELTLDWIISSPAVRARQTAGYFYEVFQPKNDLDIRRDIYHGGMEDVVDVLRSIESKAQNVLLIGHNPDLTMLVNYLGNSNIENIPTCSTSHFQTKVEEWKEINSENVKLVKVYLPKKLFY